MDLWKKRSSRLLHPKIALPVPFCKRVHGRVAPNDPIDVQLEATYNQSSCTIPFKRINKGWYLAGRVQAPAASALINFTDTVHKRS